MNHRATEKWIYRVTILACLGAWVWQHHGLELRFWWRNESHAPLWLIPGAVAVAWAVLRRRPSSRALAVGLSLLAIGGAAPSLLASRESGCGQATVDQRCAAYLKHVSLACRTSAGDHDGRLPTGGQTAWPLAIQPYARGWAPFRCPASAAADQAAAMPSSSYVLNPYLLGRRLADLPPSLRARTVLLYESDDRLSVAYRHGGMTCVAFADGTVRWFPQGRLQAVWNPWEPAASEQR